MPLTVYTTVNAACDGPGCSAESSWSTKTDHPRMTRVHLPWFTVEPGLLSEHGPALVFCSAECRKTYRKKFKK